MSTAPPDGLHSPEELAELAELRYVSDDEPGIYRKRRGGGFVFVDRNGERVTADGQLDRLRNLVIPPAWTNVWICRHRNGHLQVTGRDSKGRKQYLYHSRWTEVSNRTKFARMLHFGQALPRLRRHLRRDMSRRKLSRRKVAAAVVEILDRALIRIGNKEYAADNESFGVTTFTRDHVEVSGAKIRFSFNGKSGKFHEVELRDPRLARVLSRCEEIPGQQLFQYLEDGEYRPLESSDVNEYLRAATGDEFTAKDIRTWRGTAVAVGELRDLPAPTSQREAKKLSNAAIRAASHALGNTMTVCRKYYVHPQIIESYICGQMAEWRKTFRPRSRSRLDSDEQFLMHVLKKLPS